MPLRLPMGEVTALLGRGLARRQVMVGLDDDTACGATGEGVAVLRVTAGRDEAVAARRSALAAARTARASLVLVDRLTDGLDAEGRRTVLADLRGVAASGTAVLVDDVDPVAAIAVADGSLRADPAHGLVLERLDGGSLDEAYSAS